MARNPIPLWVAPEQDEPAHGILLRLAERNGFQSIHPISNALEVSRRDLQYGIGVDKIADAVRSDRTDILGSTFRKMSGSVMIRGEEISRRHAVKQSLRRLCPRCIDEAAFHRFWFDLAFISTCPAHGTALVSDCSCGRKLSWTDVHVTKCRHCADGDVTRVSVPCPNPELVEVDRWALGRLGVGNAVSAPALDTMPLKAALHVIERIGILDAGGFRTTWTDVGDLDVPAAELRSKGFQAIKEGRLRPLLDRVYAGYLASELRRPPSIKNAYGWLAEWFRDLRPPHMAVYFADAVLANAKSRFEISERDLQTFASGTASSRRVDR